MCHNDVFFVECNKASLRTQQVYNRLYSKNAAGMSDEYCSLAACDNMSSIPIILNMSGLWRVARWKALKKNLNLPKFCQNNVAKCFMVWWNLNWNFWAIKSVFGTKTRLLITVWWTPSITVWETLFYRDICPSVHSIVQVMWSAHLILSADISMVNHLITPVLFKDLVLLLPHVCHLLLTVLHVVVQAVEIVRSPFWVIL